MRTIRAFVVAGLALLCWASVVQIGADVTSENTYVYSVMFQALISDW